MSKHKVKYIAKDGTVIEYEGNDEYFAFLILIKAVEGKG